MEICAGGVVLSFLKYGDRRRVVNTGDAANPAALRLCCLHHYDVIQVISKIERVSDISRTLNMPAPIGAIAVKRLLCFLVDQDMSPGFQIEAAGPCVYLVMLRASQRYRARTMLEWESAVCKFVKDNVEKGVEWALLRSFALDETVLALSARSMLPCEKLVDTLQATVVAVGTPAPAFDLVATWPCLQVRQDKDPTELVGEEDTVSAVRGIRVVGYCQRTDGARYVCSRNLNEGVARKITKGERAARAVTGTPNEREIDWPQTTQKDLIQAVEELRRGCGVADCSCSVNLVREVGQLREDTALFQSPLPLAETVNCEKAESLIHPLDSIKGAEGSGFIGAHLETVRNQIRQAVRNPFIAREFADLLPLVNRIAIICKEYDIVDQRSQSGFYRNSDGHKEFEEWTTCRENAHRLAMYLEHAVRERMRDDLCGQSPPHAVLASWRYRLLSNCPREQARSTGNTDTIRLSQFRVGRPMFERSLSGLSGRPVLRDSWILIERHTRALLAFWPRTRGRALVVGDKEAIHKVCVRSHSIERKGP